MEGLCRAATSFEAVGVTGIGDTPQDTIQYNIANDDRDHPQGEDNMAKKKTIPSSRAGKSRKSPAAAPAATAKSKPRAIGGNDWREQMLARVRTLIMQAAPEMVEERKWRKPSNGMAGLPVWSHPAGEGGGGGGGGRVRIVCTGETYRDKVKLTFALGASVADPSGLFNSSLEGGTRRAIDIHEDDAIDAKWAAAFKNLIKAVVGRNVPASTRSKADAMKPGTRAKSESKRPTTRSITSIKLPGDEKTGVVLLSGGNPQIAKADGDAPVQAFIAAMPEWKHDIGKRLDALIVRTVPNVRKAVRWNTPFYGIEGQGWFLGFHCITKYVKVAFFRGAALRPLPPGESKQKDVRYLDIREGDWRSGGGKFDDAMIARWIKQASELPGENMF